MQRLLDHGSVPLVYGDVALDEATGSTIVSTETVFIYLARILQPARIILAGEVDGVFTSDPSVDPQAKHITNITPASYPKLMATLGGSAGIDVTGGMLTKVQGMVNLVKNQPPIKVYIISGMIQGQIKEVLSGESYQTGTCIQASDFVDVGA